MKIMKLYFYICFVQALLVLISCSDNPVLVENSIKADKYFPMKTGNYWIYRTTELDTLGNPTAKISIDSTVITGSRNFGGLDFFKFETYRDGTKILEEFWAADDNHIYQIRNENNEIVSGLKDMVFIIADFKATDWPVYYRKIDSADYEWQGIKGWASIENNIRCRRDFLIDSVIFNDKKLKVYTYKYISDIRYNFHHSADWIITRNKPLSYSFAENTGPVLINKFSNYLYVNYQLKDDWELGYTKQLIRCKIN